MCTARHRLPCADVATAAEAAAGAGSFPHLPPPCLPASVAATLATLVVFKVLRIGVLQCGVSFVVRRLKPPRAPVSPLFDGIPLLAGLLAFFLLLARASNALLARY